ncbi:hypothetical protein LCGC14_0632580 [marine sediment metagenome]|uniref:Uncharacterized protein n=1 Tax=marine sediment metagenome TaxID=412755 RepID=A0A0F9U9Z0_9ZZZZ
MKDVNWKGLFFLMCFISLFLYIGLVSNWNFNNKLNEELLECQKNLDIRPYKCFIREEVDNRYIFDERGWIKIDSLRTPIKEIECIDLE